MFIPFGTDRNPRRSPLVTPIIVALNTLTFAMVFVLAKETGQDVSKIIDLGAFDTREPLRAWTYVSCLFLHDPGDVFHVLFNMLFLWVFGCAVEDRMGRIGFTIFYLFGGLASVLAQWTATAIGGDHSIMIGASGAVMAVTGAFVALFPRAKIRMLVFFFLIGVFWVPALVVVGIFFALDVLGQLTNFMGLQSSNTAYWAHIGGSVFGFTVAVVLLASGILKNDDFDIFYLFKQSRRRAAMRKAVANTTAGPWASATADTPARPKTIHKRKSTPEEPKELRAARTEINRLLREHEPVRAAACYADALKDHPKFILAVDKQLDVASTLYAEERFTESAQAYEFYLERFRSDRRHRETALLLTVLYVRKHRNPERAHQLMEELEPTLTDDVHRRLLASLREELGS